MVNVEVLRDAEGRESFRVSRVFPNAPSAECACRLLEQVNPAGFEPVPNGIMPRAEAESEADGPEREVLVVDEDVIPGCPTGVCGLD